MKKTMIWGALSALTLSLALITTQALAFGAQSPGGTPGSPKQYATPTGTWIPGPGNGPNLNSGQPTSGVPAGSLPAPALTAQAGVHGKPVIYRGRVTAIDSTAITLEQADGSIVSIGLTPETQIKVPGPKTGASTGLVGMEVVVMAFTDANGNLTARMVLVIPGKPALMHRVGEVTEYTAGSSISILASDGNEYTFALTAATKILPAERAGELAVGSRVTVIAPRDPGAQGFIATGIVVHPSTSS